MTPPAAAPIPQTPSPDADVEGAEGAAEEAGYEITIAVRPSGFTVSKGALDADAADPANPAGAGADAQTASDFTAALKMAVKIYKENPVGADEQASFDAGFGGTKPAPGQPAPIELR